MPHATDVEEGQMEATELPAPPEMDDAPAPGWIIAMVWTMTLWALYYYFVAV